MSDDVISKFKEEQITKPLTEDIDQSLRGAERRNIKTMDEYFYDWENHVFGYGYGGGEYQIIPALKKIMGIIPESGLYNYIEFEASIGPVAAWLFINILCHHDIFDYGISPRYGFLTESGTALKLYLKCWKCGEFRTPDEDYSYCYPDYCNCEARTQMRCHNPFWATIYE